MKKIDYKKELKLLYIGSVGRIDMLDVPAINYLSIDGYGNPNTSQSYKDAIEALFSVSYNLKFKVKRSDLLIDYGVIPLESMWWLDNEEEVSERNKDEWRWRAMIMQLDVITQEMMKNTKDCVQRKKEDMKALQKIKFGELKEGKCVQILYIGSYAEESETIRGLDDYMMINNLQANGYHHEIYLNDGRKVSSEKLKTIISQPVK